jgi:hypothetical protein
MLLLDAGALTGWLLHNLTYCRLLILFEKFFCRVVSHWWLAILFVGNLSAVWVVAHFGFWDLRATYK